MPSNQVDVNITISQPQQDVTTLREIASSLKQGTQGRIQSTHGTVGGAADFIAQQQAMSKELGLKMSGAAISQTAGGFTASASVGGTDEKERSKNVAAAVAGIGTVVGGIGAGFKTLLGMSKVFQTFMGTTGKILSTAVDLMLAPLMPIFTKIMIWIIQTVFPIATKFGKWLDTVFGDVGAKTAISGLVAGYVGLKVASSVLTDLGTKLGAALLKHFDVDSFGSLVVKGIKGAVSGLVSFGKTVGGYVTDGFLASAKSIKLFAEGVSGHIMDGFDAARKTVTRFASNVGGLISEGLKSTGKLATQFASNVGGLISEGMKATGKLASAFASTVGGMISEGMKATGKLASAFASTVGGMISDGLKATGKIIPFASSVGGLISDGLKSGGKEIRAWANTVGGMVSEGLKATGKTVVAWANTVGGMISEGLKTTGKTIVSWASTVGGMISSGLKATGSAVTKFASAVGANIGAGIKLASGAAGKMGGAIGGSIGGAMMSAGQFSKMGGLIGVGIGAVALGGLIGYAMWKKYKEHEAGKDITVGKTRLEQVRYLQSMGMSEEQALSMQKSFVDRDVSMSKEGIESYMRRASDVADQLRMFGDVNALDIESMDRGEQTLFAEQLGGGMYGSTDYSALIKVLQNQRWQDGSRLGSAISGISANIGTGANLKTAQEELESRWYAGNALGVHWNLMDTLTPGGSQAHRATRQDEQRVREMLAAAGMDNLDDTNWWSGNWSDNLTSEQAQMGFWMTAAQGNAASSFLSPEAQKQFADKKQADAELARQAGNVTFNFQLVDATGNVIEGRTINADDLEYIKSSIASGFAFQGVTLP